MPRELSQLLAQTIERELSNLRAVTEEAASRKPSRPDAWTRKEELGHLLDSATNNHIRFVLAAIQGEFNGPGYAQNDWVALHGYNDVIWTTLLDQWHSYNLLLVHLIERIPEHSLIAPCVIGSAAPVTLGFVIEDYILHMQHHIDHLLGREKITTYPGAAMAI